jgi:hypothetical protein
MAKRAAKSQEKPKGYWENRVKTLLKIELTRQGVTYAQLAERLREMGVPETEPNVRNKLSRGTFSAMFLIQSLEALGVKELRL